MNRILYITVLFLLNALSLGAQETEMADRFREEGKIWVVIAVIALIFLSLVIFLVYLDRKIGRLERRLDNKNTES